MKTTKKIIFLFLTGLVFASLSSSLTSERDIDPPSYEPYQEMNYLHVGINIRGLSADNDRLALLHVP